MRILIELPSWLGDTVMSTPAIENLISCYSESEFIIVGSEISVEVFRSHPNISKIYVLDKKYFSILHLSQELKNFDKFYDYPFSIEALNNFDSKTKSRCSNHARKSSRY